MNIPDVIEFVQFKKREDITLSKDMMLGVEKAVKWMRFYQTQKTTLKGKKCICGSTFIPTNLTNKYCVMCSGNYPRINRFKRAMLSPIEKRNRMKHWEKQLAYRKEYNEKNKEWKREYEKQYYIKNNL